MKKIPCLFQRDYKTEKVVRDEVTPGCGWILEGRGVATRKFDGTSCLYRDGLLYRRFEVKKGKKPPAAFEPATEVDPNTGKQQGWIPVDPSPQNRWHLEALDRKPFMDDQLYDNCTYELCGPKIQGNPEHFEEHVLVRHGIFILFDAPITYEALREYLEWAGVEGIVWHSLEGPEMVKLRAKDFGINRGPLNPRINQQRSCLGV